jgi:hypothetical protein
VAVLEARYRGGPPLAEPAVKGLGDPDGGVEAADLGLVVPEHGQAVIAAGAVQAQLDDLPAPAAGEDDGLPDVPQPAVTRVVVFRQAAQVPLVSKRPGNLVGEGSARPLEFLAAWWQGRDECPAQADGVGGTGSHCPVGEGAQPVERPAAGGLADRGRPAV